MLTLEDITSNFQQSINSIRMSLPNGVAVLDNGNIIIADGGLNQLILIDSNMSEIKRVGGLGLGQFLFKEPVGVFISPSQLVYVADWHNHRIIRFDESLDYHSEFGEPEFTRSNGSINGAINGLVKFGKFAFSKGSYIQKHFEPSSEASEKLIRTENSFLVAAQVMTYWYKKHHGVFSGIRHILRPINPMNKPNGVAFMDDGSIVVSQKNSRSLCIYRNQTNGKVNQQMAIHKVDDKNIFGRLANLHWSGEYLYVCDESSSAIWCLDKQFRFNKKLVGSDSGISRFAPFSCCTVRENILAVCGGRNIQLINTLSSRVIYVTPNYCEVHGVTYDSNNNRLYVADRGARTLRILRVVD